MIRLVLVVVLLTVRLTAAQPPNPPGAANPIRPPTLNTGLATNRLAVRVTRPSGAAVRPLSTKRSIAAGRVVVLTSTGEVRLELTLNLKTSPLTWVCASNVYAGTLYIGAKLTGDHPELQRELSRGVTVRVSGENSARAEPDVVTITKAGTEGEQSLSLFCGRGAGEAVIKVRSDYDEERYSAPLQKLNWRARLCCLLEKVMPCAVWGWAVIGGWIGALLRAVTKREPRWQAWLGYLVEGPLAAIVLVLITHAGLAKMLLGLDISGAVSAVTAAALGAFIGFAGAVWLEKRIPQ